MKAFKCKRCGRCCQGESTVSLSQSEIKRIAKYLGLSEEEFLKRFTVLKKPNRIEMKTKNGHCIFFDEKTNGCLIHPVKPDFCRIWPFVPSIFEDLNSFKVVQQFCEALKQVSWEEIKESLKNENSSFLKS